MMPTALEPKLPSLFFESMRAQMLNTEHLLWVDCGMGERMTVECDLQVANWAITAQASFGCRPSHVASGRTTETEADNEAATHGPRDPERDLRALLRRLFLVRKRRPQPDRQDLCALGH